jgi:hypothetical protein
VDNGRDEGVVYAAGYDDGVNAEIGMVNVQDGDININISFDVWEDRLLDSVDSIVLELCETVAGLLQDVIVFILPFTHRPLEMEAPVAALRRSKNPNSERFGKDRSVRMACHRNREFTNNMPRLFGDPTELDLEVWLYRNTKRVEVWCG